MDKIDCLKCEYWLGEHIECEYSFRWASNAGGAAVDCKEDVWRCQDYKEKENYDD